MPACGDQPVLITDSNKRVSISMLFLGIDVGSSSVKLSVLDGASGKSLGALSHPESELAILSPAVGFAEQDPETWWDCVRQGLARLAARDNIALDQIDAIGISYQMHGLVLVDSN